MPVTFLRVRRALTPLRTMRYAECVIHNRDLAQSPAHLHLPYLVSIVLPCYPLLRVGRSTRREAPHEERVTMDLDLTPRHDRKRMSSEQQPSAVRVADDPGDAEPEGFLFLGHACPGA